MTYLSRFTSHFSQRSLFAAVSRDPVCTCYQDRGYRRKEEAASYFGDWTNAHGDTLQITSDSIQVNDEKPVRYDDITEDSDGSFFVLQIKDGNGSSYFEGKFLRITFGKDPDRFTMSIYKTLADALKKENEVKRVRMDRAARGR